MNEWPHLVTTQEMEEGGGQETKARPATYLSDTLDKTLDNTRDGRRKRPGTQETRTGTQLEDRDLGQNLKLNTHGKKLNI